MENDLESTAAPGIAEEIGNAIATEREGNEGSGEADNVGGGRWIHRVTAQKLGGESGRLRFIVIGCLPFVRILLKATLNYTIV